MIIILGIIVILTVIPIGTSMSAEHSDDLDSGLFTNDGQYLHRWVELGSEIQLRYNTTDNTVTGNSSGTVEFFVREDSILTEFLTWDEYYDTAQILGISEFNSNLSKTQTHSHSFLPKQVGPHMYHFQIYYNIPKGESHGIAVPFFIVEKFSKAYSENNGCRDGFEVLMKSDFSTIVCVTHDSASKITQRGGWGPL